MAAGVVDAAEEFAAVLVDVTLLSDCDAFVGKFTSNLDRLAYALLVFRRRTLAPYISAVDGAHEATGIMHVVGNKLVLYAGENSAMGFGGPYFNDVWAAELEACPAAEVQV